MEGTSVIHGGVPVQARHSVLAKKAPLSQANWDSPSLPDYKIPRSDHPVSFNIVHFATQSLKKITP